MRVSSFVYTGSYDRWVHTFRTLAGDLAVVVGPTSHENALRTLSWLGTNTRP